MAFIDYGQKLLKQRSPGFFAGPQDSTPAATSQEETEARVKAIVGGSSLSEQGKQWAENLLTHIVDLEPRVKIGDVFNFVQQGQPGYGAAASLQFKHKK